MAAIFIKRIINTLEDYGKEELHDLNVVRQRRHRPPSPFEVLTEQNDIELQTTSTPKQPALEVHNKPIERQLKHIDNTEPDGEPKIESYNLNDIEANLSLGYISSHDTTSEIEKDNLFLSLSTHSNNSDSQLGYMPSFLNSSEATQQLQIAAESDVCPADNVPYEANEFKFKKEPIKRLPPINRTDFESFFDPDGRLINEHGFKKSIFKGGVEEEIRDDVWKFLFGLYPSKTTARERDIIKARNHIQYESLKTRWYCELKRLCQSDPKAVKLCPDWYSGCSKRQHVRGGGGIPSDTDSYDSFIGGSEKLVDTDQVSSDDMAAPSAAELGRDLQEAFEGGLVDNEDEMRYPHDSWNPGTGKEAAVLQVTVENVDHTEFQASVPPEIKLRPVQSEVHTGSAVESASVIDASHDAANEDISDALRDAMREDDDTPCGTEQVSGEDSIYVGDNFENVDPDTPFGSFSGEEELSDLICERKERQYRLSETLVGWEVYQGEHSDHNGGNRSADPVLSIMETSVDLNLTSSSSELCVTDGISESDFCKEGAVDDTSEKCRTSPTEIEITEILHSEEQSSNEEESILSDAAASYIYSPRNDLVHLDDSTCGKENSIGRTGSIDVNEDTSNLIRDVDEDLLHKNRLFNDKVELDDDLDGPSSQGPPDIESISSSKGDLDGPSRQEPPEIESISSSERDLDGPSSQEPPDVESISSSKGDLYGPSSQGPPDIESNSWSKEYHTSLGHTVITASDDDNIIYPTKTQTTYASDWTCNCHNTSWIDQNYNVENVNVLSIGERNNQSNNENLSCDRCHKLRRINNGNKSKTNSIPTSPKADSEKAKVNLTRVPHWIAQIVHASSPGGSKATKQTIKSDSIENSNEVQRLPAPKSFSGGDSSVPYTLTYPCTFDTSSSVTQPEEVNNFSETILTSSQPIESEESKPEDNYEVDIIDEATDREFSEGLARILSARGIEGLTAALELHANLKKPDLDKPKLSSTSKTQQMANNDFISHLLWTSLTNSTSDEDTWGRQMIQFSSNPSVAQFDFENPELHAPDSPNDGSCPYYNKRNEVMISVSSSFGCDLLKSLELEAQLVAARQKYTPLVVLEAVRIIDKDIPRTDRELEYFSGDDNKHLLMLRDALITYAFFHPEVGYAQGMNDIMSQFLVVLNSEPDAYWMFCSYMDHFKANFMEEGMLKKISMVDQLLMKMDRRLYDFLQERDMDLMFCHRWLLLCFKREFCHKDALILFEVISSHYLEVFSLEAEMERYKERAKELERNEGNRTEEIDSTPEYSFDVFVCVTMLHEYRDLIMKNKDFVDIYRAVLSLPQGLDVNAILAKAEELFYKYCRKSITDSFQVIHKDEVSDKSNPTLLDLGRLAIKR